MSHSNIRRPRACSVWVPYDADMTQGELLPFQGGTNEMIANKLYKGLSEQEKDRLHIYNYVAKDQTRPIHNKFKKRSCHSKSI